MSSTQTVYIDVLIGVNLFVNYFLLLAVARFFCLSVKRIRLIAAAFAGALFSITIFLPELSPLIGLLVKFCISAVIVRIGFTWRGVPFFLRILACFYLVSFAFAGFMLCLWYFISPQGLMIKNSVVYFDVSPLFLFGATIISYLMIRLIHRLTGRQEAQALNCAITVERGEKILQTTALVDTGNSLREPFTGYPVVIVEEALIKELMPACDEKTVLRLIPCTTVSGKSLMPAFRPDKLTVAVQKKKVEVENVYIAISRAPLSSGEFGALISPELLP